MKRASKILGFLMVIAAIATACDKVDRGGTMSVRMVDQPIAFQEVNVEIRQVKVNYEDRRSAGAGWLSLNTNQGIYNLLELQNGVSATLVHEYHLPVGHVSQMRLILGNENNVKVGGAYYPLELSSQDEAGLKLNIDADIRHGERVDVLFDFDAEQSIVVNGNGNYRLKPVLHLVHVKHIQ